MAFQMERFNIYLFCTYGVSHMRESRTRHDENKILHVGFKRQTHVVETEFERIEQDNKQRCECLS